MFDMFNVAAYMSRSHLLYIIALMHAIHAFQ